MSFNIIFYGECSIVEGETNVDKFEQIDRKYTLR